MLVAEWDVATEREVEREEAYEEGLEQGREEILSLINKGYTLEAIKEKLARPVVSP